MNINSVITRKLRQKGAKIWPSVQCPSDMIDQIGGWPTVGIGQGYGDGYSLEAIKITMKMIQ